MIPIGQAIDNGAKLVVIDPRRTDSSKRASMLIQPNPGTDAALALAIANILILNDWIDHNYIDRNVKGFAAFKEHVKKFSSEWAEEVTGVPESLIYKLAWQIGNVKPMTLIPGYGMQRYSNGGQTVRCLLALSVLTGNIGKPGACWHYANLQSYVFDDILEPLSYYPPEKPDGIIRRSISTARLGTDMLSTINPPLKMIWVERGNPVAQNPDTSNVLKAFRKLDFRVVVEQFYTDTALEADLILPAKNMFEQSDIIGSYWNPYVQLKQ
jgi:anaerobic selenocysteine-containing dehydrogenase